ncbi:hypothetical protein [Streptomyces neyagawaensis]|uniref:hypothetical protein n=1 Tax=Streptomyces neyagawaensis TaxID=42238 RepID=UPI003F4CD94B
MYADLQGLQGPKRDTDEAVRARMKRQAWLYEGGRKFHALVWEVDDTDSVATYLKV